MLVSSMNSAPVSADPIESPNLLVNPGAEDYDNLYLGVGNEGNHIPMIVIPSPNSGMRQGHIVVVDHNNHYSLPRTIEDALKLPRLTNNDRFAQPMNEYWP
jgi:hypothetical protein